MKAHEIRAIPQEYSEEEQKAHTDVLREIISAQKKGQDRVNTRTIFGFPRIWKKLEDDGFTVSFDNGLRFWRTNVPSTFTVSWAREAPKYDTNDNDFYP